MQPNVLKTTAKTIQRFLIIGTTLFFSTALVVTAQDRKAPIMVEADLMEYDNANQIVTYTGNAIAIQDTLTIKAGSIEVRQDPQGYQLGLAKGSQKKRAFFIQDRPVDFERIEGEATRLEYDSRTATLKLVGDAVLRRYKNNELSDQTTGGVITYNDHTSFFTVESGPNRASSNGRVKGFYTPQPSKESK